MDNEEKKAPFTKDIYDVIEIFAVITAIFMLIIILAFRTSMVDGPSMNDTLKDGEIIIVQELGYKPQKGDIVIAQNISLNNGLDIPLVKRVIATAGDTLVVDSTNKTVIVNGETLDEPYAKYEGTYRGYSEKWVYPITIPDGYCFIMGDNRYNSTDSRSSLVGLIDERCIVGKVIIDFPVPSFISSFIKSK